MSPALVKYLVLPAHEKLLGRKTLRYLRQIEQSQWWPHRFLQGLQEAKLRLLLMHAHAQCPFYRQRLAEAGIDPWRARLGDLVRLRPITKSEIAEHADEIVDKGQASDLIDYSTGGSTGAPLVFKIDRRRQASDQAARARTRRWFGIDLGQRELYLWGSPVELTAQDCFRSLRDRLANHRLLDAFHMTKRSMSRYLTEIERFDPVHLFGYPSSLARLFQFARDIGRPLRAPSLRAIFVTGEFFDRADRAVIEEAAAVPVADGYGSREGGFVAHQCPLGAYHVTMESHIVELLDTKDRPVAEGENGEITLTHLDAFGMPFIRYRTGDMARRAGADAPPCPCGRGLETLVAIEGRRTDMLRTADGGHTHGLSVIYVLREVGAIRQFKIAQRPNLDLDVSMVLRRELTRKERDSIASQLKKRIGGDIAVRFNVVERIESDRSGKYRHVVGSPAMEAGDTLVPQSVAR
jgi:phenylacetate-CoA ligase